MKIEGKHARNGPQSRLSSFVELTKSVFSGSTLAGFGTASNPSKGAKVLYLHRDVHSAIRTSICFPAIKD